MPRITGELDQAARIQQRLIQKFPDDHQLRNHLATVFMTYGQNSAAEEVLLEVRIAAWPGKGEGWNAVADIVLWVVSPIE